ncbi:MAG: hypothetical protein JWR84_2203 [Caulobacter sp.]|nr:hypothetical protein [Caulobacter sp.]
MKRLRPFAVGALLLVTSCATGAAPQANVARLPASEAKDLLKQCSREDGAPFQSAFRPTMAEVRAMQVALPAALAADTRPQGPSIDRPLSGWRGQYVGVVRDGRRYVYGNFLPVGSGDGPNDWTTKALIVCDGGARFWGAEHDISANRITHLAYNGSLG